MGKYLEMFNFCLYSHRLQFYITLQRALFIYLVESQALSYNTQESGDTKTTINVELTNSNSVGEQVVE